MCAENAANFSEEIDPQDDAVLECIEIEKENGITLASLKQVCNSVGAEREAWRLAMQAEVQSLKGNGALEVASSSELRKVKSPDALPVKLAVPKVSRKAGPVRPAPQAHAINQLLWVDLGRAALHQPTLILQSESTAYSPSIENIGALHLYQHTLGIWY